MKTITKIFQLWPTIAFALFVLFRIYMKSSHDFREQPVSFSTFDTTEISGRIQYIGNQEQGDYFRIFRDIPGRYYYVKLVELVPSVSMGLRYSATLGDSVVKHKFSNTLILFKANTAEYYSVVAPPLVINHASMQSRGLPSPSY